jgi:hypothetical protein
MEGQKCPLLFQSFALYYLETIKTRGVARHRRLSTYNPIIGKRSEGSRFKASPGKLFVRRYLEKNTQHKTEWFKW